MAGVSADQPGTSRSCKPQQQHVHYEPHHFQNSPPMPASQHQMWNGTGAGGHGLLEAAAATSTGPDGRAPYAQMNSILAQLHSERVRAGARAPWVEEPDDDDEEDW